MSILIAEDINGWFPISVNKKNKSMCISVCLHAT